MFDVEDFNSVFQGIGYSDGAVQQIQSYRHALGGKTFFERLLELLRIQGKNLYPPRSNKQLQELHQQIVSSETTLHNKHCLIFYLLKDLSPHQHETTELASTFARDVHLEKRFWTFIEGLWALDHLEFRTAVENLTHPSIIPTFPDEIMYTLLKGSDKLGAIGAQEDKQDEILPLAYYNCVKPPLADTRTRNEFAKYFAARNVTEAYHWIHTRPEHEQKGLLELVIEQTLHGRAWSSNEGMYTPQEMAMEFVSLPFSEEEEEFIEKFLTEGKGRSYQGAQDTVLMRRIAMGRLADVAGEVGARGRKHDGVNWEILKDGVGQGLGPRKEEESFRV